jgi:hypothetical protein
MIFGFGLPGSGAGHSASRAVLASMDVRDAITGETGLQVGCGIAMGACYCGPVGCVGVRTEYVIAGDRVNLAARLCFKSKNGFLVTKEIVEDIRLRGTTRTLVFEDGDEISVKGKNEKVLVYTPKLRQLVRDDGTLPALLPSRKHLCVKARYAVTRQLVNATSPRQSLVITGAPGTGKLVFSRHLCHQLTLRHSEHRLLEVPLAASNASIAFHAIYQLLAALLNAPDLVVPQSGQDFLGTHAQPSGPRRSHFLPCLADPGSWLPDELYSEFEEEAELFASLTGPERLQALHPFLVDLLAFVEYNAFVIMSALHHIDPFSWRVLADVLSTPSAITFVFTSRPLHVSSPALFVRYPSYFPPLGFRASCSWLHLARLIRHSVRISSMRHPAKRWTRFCIRLQLWYVKVDLASCRKERESGPR